jgi:hypothetical protein
MWALKPFTYLFHTYWSADQPVEVLCETKPNFWMPDNFSFYRVDVDQQGWPKELWSNGLIKYLENIQEAFVIILLEDYWLNRTVDIGGISTLCEYMTINPDVLRFDLTMDRLYANGPLYPHDDFHGCYGHYDLIDRQGTMYQMSLQPGIWNRRLMLNILKNNWSPWEVELEGTSILNEKEDIRVLGTRQNLLSYTNGLKNEADNINTDKIPPEHLERISKWFPPKSRPAE